MSQHLVVRSKCLPSTTSLQVVTCHDIPCCYLFRIYRTLDRYRVMLSFSIANADLELSKSLITCRLELKSPGQKTAFSLRTNAKHASGMRSQQEDMCLPVLQHRSGYVFKTWYIGIFNANFMFSFNTPRA